MNIGTKVEPAGLPCPDPGTAYGETPKEAIAASIQKTPIVDEDAKGMVAGEDAPFLSANVNHLNEYDWAGLDLEKTGERSPSVSIRREMAPERDAAIVRIEITNIWITCENQDGTRVGAEYSANVKVPEQCLSTLSTPPYMVRWEAKLISRDDK